MFNKIWKEQIVKPPSNVGIFKPKQGFDLEEDDDGDCNRQLKEYVDKVNGRKHYKRYQTLENIPYIISHKADYESIPEPVACYALEIINDYVNLGNSKVEEWGHCDSNGNEVGGGFFDPKPEWIVYMVNYSRGGGGRINYNIEGKKYAILEFWVRNKNRHPNNYPIIIEVSIQTKQESRVGGIPKSEAIGDLDFMKKYVDWR